MVRGAGSGKASQVRRPARVLGYGSTGIHPQNTVRQVILRRPVLSEVAAWLATTAVAGALLLLLAQQSLVAALLLAVGYGAASWLLWRTRPEDTSEESGDS